LSCRPRIRPGKAANALLTPVIFFSFYDVSTTAFKMKKVTPPWWGVRGLLFSSIFKSIIMTYIVKEGKELKIITVRVDQEAFFQADYAGRILASGNNTMEALMNYGQLPESSDINDDLNEDELPE
jgi:hypothetical protein